MSGGWWHFNSTLENMLWRPTYWAKHLLATDAINFFPLPETFNMNPLIAAL
jgi:hypothetical protein